MIDFERRHTSWTLALVLWASTSLVSASQAPPSPPSDAEARVALGRFMADRAAGGFSGVVIVARGGTVLLERGYGFLDATKTVPAAADSVFTVGSITKQFTAAAILKLEMQGRLSTADPMTKYLPGVPDDKRAITIHQLLTHTAGFAPVSGDDLEPIGRDAFLRLIMSRPLAHPPGAYEYSNVGYSVLAAIVELVSGRDYESFLADQLFAPAHMSDTGYSRPKWARNRLAHGINDDGTDRGTFGEVAIPNGTPGWHLLGNGGILSTVGDMYRWHQTLSGESVLDASAKAKMFRKWVDEGGGTSYGYGWSIEDTPFGRLVMHNGGNPFFFSDFLRYVDRDVIVYFSTNSRDRAMRRLARPLAQIALTGRVIDAPALTFTAVASAAPSSGPAARWNVPEGPAFAASARLLDAVAEPDAAKRRQRVPDVFAPALVERRGIDALVELLGRLNGDIGSARLSRIEESRDGSSAITAVRLHFTTPGRPAVALTLMLDPPVRSEGATRVAGIALELGD